MKKRNLKCLFLIISVAAFTGDVKAQLWDSLNGGINAAVRVMYTDTVDNYLYSAGVFNTADGNPVKGIARWNGSEWDSLTSGIDGLDVLNPFPQNTLAMVRYNSKLYVGGAFGSLGDKSAHSIGTWNGTNWDTLSPQPFKTNYSNAVYSLEVIANQLYIGGIFDSVAGIPCKSIVKWDGTSYTTISFPPEIAGNTSSIFVYSICEYNGEIYIGGNFNSPLYPNDTIQDIIRYDGTNWRSVGGGLNGALSIIGSMVVYDGELYVAGYFTTSDGNTGNSIQKWDGTNWSDVGGGVNGQIHKLLVLDGKLYALGSFNTAGGISAEYIGVWDGTNWCGLGSTFDNVILSGSVYNDSLYIGGGFSAINGDDMHHVSHWVGGSFLASCGNTSGIDHLQTIENSLNVYPNPSSNQIAIEFDLFKQGLASIEIRNVLGQIVYSKSAQLSQGKQRIEIDVSDFTNGVYFIQLLHGDKLSRAKFIKQ